MADLTTLANVKQWLGIPPAQTASDALLSRMITACSDFIETWCSRTFAISSYAETRDGQGGSRLMFANYPVTEVTSVGVDYRPVYASNGVGGPGFLWDDISITLLGYGFTRGQANVKLAYKAGYATTPPAVEQACIEMIGLRYREMDRIGMVSKTLAGETIAFSQKDMSDAINTILGQYKKVIPV